MNQIREKLKLCQDLFLQEKPTVIINGLSDSLDSLINSLSPEYVAFKTQLSDYKRKFEEGSPTLKQTVSATANSVLKAVSPILLGTSIAFSEIQSLSESNIIRYFYLGQIKTVLDLLEKMLPPSSQTQIFISHSSKDAVIVDKFVEQILKLGCGFRSEHILCTSIESTGIRHGEDMRDYLKETMGVCQYVFLMISENYKKSPICLNEMGAAWALGKKVRPFLLPGMDYNDMEWVYATKQAAKIDVPVKLDSLYDEMIDTYGFAKKVTSDWTKYKQNFLDVLKS